MDKIITKMDEAGRLMLQAQSIQHLITLALDAGDDSERTTSLYLASKVTEEKISDATTLLDQAGFIGNPVTPADAEELKPKALAKRSPFAIALDRHKAAKAAWDAKPDADRIDNDPVGLAVGNTLIDLAETPCASDAEFLEKLKYLLEEESEEHGEYYKLAEYGSIIAAVDTHFGDGTLGIIGVPPADDEAA